MFKGEAGVFPCARVNDSFIYIVNYIFQLIMFTKYRRPYLLTQLLDEELKCDSSQLFNLGYIHFFVAVMNPISKICHFSSFSSSTRSYVIHTEMDIYGTEVKSNSYYRPKPFSTLTVSKTCLILWYRIVLITKRKVHIHKRMNPYFIDKFTTYF